MPIKRSPGCNCCGSSVVEDKIVCECLYCTLDDPYSFSSAFIWVPEIGREWEEQIVAGTQTFTPQGVWSAETGDSCKVYFQLETPYDQTDPIYSWAEWDGSGIISVPSSAAALSFYYFRAETCQTNPSLCDQGSEKLCTEGVPLALDDPDGLLTDPAKPGPNDYLGSYAIDAAYCLCMSSTAGGGCNYSYASQRFTNTRLTADEALSNFVMLKDGVPYLWQITGNTIYDDDPIDHPYAIRMQISDVSPTGPLYQNLWFEPTSGGEVGKQMVVTDHFSFDIKYNLDTCGGFVTGTRVDDPTETITFDWSAWDCMNTGETAPAGVGTFLAESIPKWAARQKSGCGCKDMQAKMDRRGVEWCEANRNTIVSHLISQRGNLTPALRVLPSVALRTAANLLLDKAIAKTKEEDK